MNFESAEHPQILKNQWGLQTVLKNKILPAHKNMFRLFACSYFCISPSLLHYLEMPSIVTTFPPSFFFLQTAHYFFIWCHFSWLWDPCFPWLSQYFFLNPGLTFIWVFAFPISFTVHQTLFRELYCLKWKKKTYYNLGEILSTSLILWFQTRCCWQSRDSLLYIKWLPVVYDTTICLLLLKKEARDTKGKCKRFNWSHFIIFLSSESHINIPSGL